MFGREFSKMTVQEPGDEGRDDRQSYHRPALGGIVDQVTIQRLSDGLHFLPTADHDHAATGRCEPTIDTIEQSELEALLERQDAPANRGLVHAKRLRRRHHGLVLRQHQHVA